MRTYIALLVTTLFCTYLCTNSKVARADARRTGLQAFSFINAKMMSSSEKNESSVSPNNVYVKVQIYTYWYGEYYNGMCTCTIVFHSSITSVYIYMPKF